MNAGKVSIVVPTYNERENVRPLCQGIGAALDNLWDYEIIIVDDNSPDGTQDVVRELAVENARIKLLARPGKQGLGTAVKEGFSLATGDYWVMMDADLSHRPSELPRILEGLKKFDIVVGSRYVAGGAVENWPIWRQWASRIASMFGRVIVGLDVRDLTSGLAAFRKATLEPILPRLNPKGFKLLLEILANNSGSSNVKEIPITFVDREKGKSKASGKEALIFLRLCFHLRNVRSNKRY